MTTDTITTLFSFLRNKSAAVVALAAALYGYTRLAAVGPENPPLPFIEIAYTGLTLLAVIVVAPILRMFVFGEAAKYAETGQLDKDLATGKYTPALVHYWIATALCYGAAIACLATITK